MAAFEEDTASDADSSDETDMRRPAVVPETIQEDGGEFRVPVSTVEIIVEL